MDVEARSSRLPAYKSTKTKDALVIEGVDSDESSKVRARRMGGGARARRATFLPRALNSYLPPLRDENSPQMESLRAQLEEERRRRIDMERMVRSLRKKAVAEEEEEGDEQTQRHVSALLDRQKREVKALKQQARFHEYTMAYQNETIRKLERRLTGPPSSEGAEEDAEERWEALQPGSSGAPVTPSTRPAMASAVPARPRVPGSAPERVAVVDESTAQLHRMFEMRKALLGQLPEGGETAAMHTPRRPPSPASASRSWPTPGGSPALSPSVTADGRSPAPAHRPSPSSSLRGSWRTTGGEGGVDARLGGSRQLGSGWGGGALRTSGSIPLIGAARTPLGVSDSRAVHYLRQGSASYRSASPRFGNVNELTMAGASPLENYSLMQSPTASQRPCLGSYENVRRDERGNYWDTALKASSHWMLPAQRSPSAARRLSG